MQSAFAQYTICIPSQPHSGVATPRPPFFVEGMPGHLSNLVLLQTCPDYPHPSHVRNQGCMGTKKPPPEGGRGRPRPPNGWDPTPHALQSVLLLWKLFQQKSAEGGRGSSPRIEGGSHIYPLLLISCPSPQHLTRTLCPDSSLPIDPCGSPKPFCMLLGRRVEPLGWDTISHLPRGGGHSLGGGEPSGSGKEANGPLAEPIPAPKAKPHPHTHTQSQSHTFRFCIIICSGYTTKIRFFEIGIVAQRSPLWGHSR